MSRAYSKDSVKKRGRLCEREIRTMPWMGKLGLRKRRSFAQCKRPAPALSDSKANPQSHRIQVLPRMRNGLSLWSMVGIYGKSLTLSSTLGKKRHWSLKIRILAPAGLAQ